jgi:HK97 gp10 family phage protein
MLNIDIVPSFGKVAKAFKSIEFGKALQVAIKTMAFLVEREAKQVTPVDTGRLRASIGVDLGNLQARIAPNTDYAGFVHEGTKFMHARPYMKWGLEKAEPKFSDLMKGQVEAEIKTELNKI